MEWVIPGTVIAGRREESDGLQEKFSAMFLAGGIVLSQVSSITGLEAYTVQNWVKRGFLSPPQRKRYTLRQLCRVMNINMLKSVLPMEKICGLLGYINGALDDESDDLIDDTVLYFTFVRLAARAGELPTGPVRHRAIEETLQGYREPVPGARERVEHVLEIMLTAWSAAQLQRQAEEMLAQIEKAG